MYMHKHLGGAQQLLDKTSDGLDDGVLGEVRLVDLGYVRIESFRTNMV